jgi:hypothetical protein
VSKTKCAAQLKAAPGKLFEIFQCLLNFFKSLISVNYTPILKYEFLLKSSETPYWWLVKLAKKTCGFFFKPLLCI